MERFAQNEKIQNQGVTESTIIDALQEQRKEWYSNDNKIHGVHQTIVDWCRAIEEKYPDAREYTLFHTLIGSTPPPGLTKFDLPGDDSVMKFADSLSKNLSAED